MTCSHVHRSVDFCPLDEFPRDGFAECDTGLIIHFVVDAGPDTAIAGVLADGANELGTRREQICEDLASCR